jgi:hypothetical protein
MKKILIILIQLTCSFSSNALLIQTPIIEKDSAENKVTIFTQKQMMTQKSINSGDIFSVILYGIAAFEFVIGIILLSNPEGDYILVGNNISGRIILLGTLLWVYLAYQAGIPSKQSVKNTGKKK